MSASSYILYRKSFEILSLLCSTEFWASKKYEIHKIPFYLYELSNLFHAYWSRGNEDKKYKFIEDNKIKRAEIFIIIKLISIVIENGMKILGVSLPRQMWC